MKIAVLGGAGFIGRHLVESCLRDGHEVVAVDNFFTGSKRNLDALADEFPHKLEFVRHDICEPFHLEVDEIYHAACPAAPLHYARNPARTIETGVVGTLNALKLAREVGARILVFSTSECYGNPLVHPQKETYWGNVNPVGSRACYDEAKRCSEALSVAYYSQYSVDVRIVRIFNTYGPFMAKGDGRVMPAFLEALRKNTPMVVHGTGSQTRSFCYVDDLVSGLRKYMGVELDPLKVAGMPIVNLGNPEEVTVLEMAKTLAQLAGKPDHPVTFKPNPIGDDPERRCPDITRAKEWLGWSPTVSLKSGLQKTLDWWMTP